MAAPQRGEMNERCLQIMFDKKKLHEMLWESHSRKTIVVARLKTRLCFESPQAKMPQGSASLR